MADMPWKDAINQILDKADSAMHYSDIAEKIVEEQLRSSIGATPASTVNAYITTSMKEDGPASPFVRVGRGEYILRSKFEPNQEAENLNEEIIVNEEKEESNSLVKAFGMFWQRELVIWNNSPNVLGKQQIGAIPVNFSDQLGVYLLHDGREVVYVGRATDRPLGKRLYEHTQDRLRGRWNRFSWFGLLKVTSDGLLEETAITSDKNIIISTFEALLIEGLEPPQNRKRGDDFNAIEYLQAEDPEIEKQQMRALLSEMQRKLQ